MVINQVFKARLPDVLSGNATLLQTLQARITTQLSLLDDAWLTAGQLGVSAAELAEQLTRNLVREIEARGTRGGPLAPLADQLNHDETHLQLQQLGAMLSAVQEALARTGLSNIPAAPTVGASPGTLEKTMTAERRDTYQAFIVAADELRSVLITSAAAGTPPEIFVDRVAQSVQAIDRAYSEMLLAGSKAAVAAAGQVKQMAERILMWCNTFDESLGTLGSEYGKALNTFAQLARNEAGT